MATARKQPANEETGEDGIRGRVRFDTDVSVIEWMRGDRFIHRCGAIHVWGPATLSSFTCNLLVRKHKINELYKDLMHVMISLNLKRYDHIEYGESQCHMQ